ncbi:hypothetical protein GGF31_005175 [Allomyces arbusculus]|nr:hypothetical protein GGF31_005175 [Allomyces arbusculus]
MKRLFAPNSRRPSTSSAASPRGSVHQDADHDPRPASMMAPGGISLARFSTVSSTATSLFTSAPTLRPSGTWSGLDRPNLRGATSLDGAACFPAIVKSKGSAPPRALAKEQPAWAVHAPLRALAAPAAYLMPLFVAASQGPAAGTRSAVTVLADALGTELAHLHAAISRHLDRHVRVPLDTCMRQLNEVAANRNVRVMYALRKLADRYERDVLPQLVKHVAPTRGVPTTVEALVRTDGRVAELLVKSHRGSVLDLADTVIHRVVRKRGVAKTLFAPLTSLSQALRELATCASFIDHTVANLLPIVHGIATALASGDWSEASARDAASSALTRFAEWRQTIITILDEIKTGLATLYPPANEFQCPICLEIMAEAAILSCKHRFCPPCLDEYRRQTNGTTPGTVFVTFTNDEINSVVVSQTRLDDEIHGLLGHNEIAPIESTPTRSPSASSTAASDSAPSTHVSPSTPSTNSTSNAPHPPVIGRRGTFTMQYESPFLPAHADANRPLMVRLPCPMCRRVTVTARGRPLPTDQTWTEHVAQHFPREVATHRRAAALTDAKRKVATAAKAVQQAVKSTRLLGRPVGVAAWARSNPGPQAPRVVVYRHATRYAGSATDVHAAVPATSTRAPRTSPTAPVLTCTPAANSQYRAAALAAALATDVDRFHTEITLHLDTQVRSGLVTAFEQLKVAAKHNARVASALRKLADQYERDVHATLALHELVAASTVIDGAIASILPALRETTALVDVLREPDSTGMREAVSDALNRIAEWRQSVVSILGRIKTGLSTLLPAAQDFQCPICLDIMADAAVLSCKHRFCPPCIDEYRRRTNGVSRGTVFVTFVNDAANSVVLSAAPHAIDDEVRGLLGRNETAPVNDLVAADDDDAAGDDALSTQETASPTITTARPATNGGGGTAVGRPGTFTMQYESPFLPTAHQPPVMVRLPCPICRQITVTARGRALPTDAHWAEHVAAYFPREVTARRRTEAVAAAKRKVVRAAKAVQHAVATTRLLGRPLGQAAWAKSNPQPARAG